MCKELKKMIFPLYSSSILNYTGSSNDVNHFLAKEIIG